MPRKKTNPRRVPVCVSSDEARRMIEAEGDRMILCAWAVVLNAMADRWDMTPERLMDFCESVNRGSAGKRTSEGVEASLGRLEALTGQPFPFYSLCVTGLRTQGDVERLRRRADVSAMYSMFALIADAVLSCRFLTEEDIRGLFQKARSLTDELFDGCISLQDLLGVLKDEFGRRLADDGHAVSLQPLG